VFVTELSDAVKRRKPLSRQTDIDLGFAHPELAFWLVGLLKNIRNLMRKSELVLETLTDWKILTWL
jgi:hypothetical protein